MNNNPLVSANIDVYNEEKYIKKCLSSIFQQTYKNIEIIVVNDGSSDNSLEILDKFKNKLLILNNNHYGPGFSRNCGAKKANGKILVFIDGDMVLDKNFVENITYPIITKKSILATYTSKEFVANYINIWAKCWNIDSGKVNKNRVTNIDIFSFRAIKTTVYLYLKGFNPNYGYFDDKSLFLKGLKPLMVNNAVCYHYNPSTLKEVYFSARWIGRAPEFAQNIRNFLRYSIINSLRNGFLKVKQGAPLQYLLFKIIFDLGILSGLLFKNKNSNYAK